VKQLRQSTAWRSNDLEFLSVRVKWMGKLLEAQVSMAGSAAEVKLLRERYVEQLKLLQKQVAKQLGVDEASVYNWENNRSKPGLVYMPAIIRFLGYNPLPPVDGWADGLVQRRTILGLSQKESAKRLGVDPGTLARWERGEREPTGKFAARVSHFLSAKEATKVPVVTLSA